MVDKRQKSHLMTWHHIKDRETMIILYNPCLETSSLTGSAEVTAYVWLTVTEMLLIADFIIGIQSNFKPSINTILKMHVKFLLSLSIDTGKGILWKQGNQSQNMSLVTRKPVFGVFATR